MNTNKLKSKALWLSFFSLMFLVLKRWLGLEIDGALWDMTVEAIITLLVAAGIISDNSKGEWYVDEEQKL
jgi:uncharacterized membrane protein